jgi:hypothetical protein
MPEVLRARLTELRARMYHLECEKTMVSASIRVVEARLGAKTRDSMPDLVETERSASHDASVSATALRRASAEHAEVLGRCRAIADEAAARAAPKIGSDDA